MVERTQVLAEDFAMALLVARCFRRIHSKLRSGAMRERSRKEESAMEAAEGTRLVNSRNPPPRPLYSFWIKDNGLQRGARIANGSPPTVKKRRKFTALPHSTVPNSKNDPFIGVTEIFCKKQLCSV
jgi:hypothetical protein